MEPITRAENYLADAAGDTVENLPTPITRAEFFLTRICARLKAIDEAQKSISREITDFIQNGDYVTSGEMRDALELIPKFGIAVVDALPTEDISDTTIYLVTTGNETDNLYTEYIYVDSKWEMLGTQKMDLSGYATKVELDEALGGKVDKDGDKVLTDINYSADEQAKVTASYEAKHTHPNKEALDGITAARMDAWDAAEVNVNADWESDSGDSQILHKPAHLVQDADYVHTDNNFTNACKDKLTGIEAGAQVNTVTGGERLR